MMLAALHGLQGSRELAPSGHATLITFSS